MFLAVVKAYFHRINVFAAVEAVYHHPGPLVFIFEMGCVDPHDKIVFYGKLHLFFENRHFVFGVFVQADFAHAQNRWFV